MDTAPIQAVAQLVLKGESSCLSQPFGDQVVAEGLLRGRSENPQGGGVSSSMTKVLSPPTCEPHLSLLTPT